MMVKHKRALNLRNGIRSPSIYLHGRKLESIFELLGTHENDLTFSMGWALSQCTTLRNTLIAELFGHKEIKVDSVLLQEHATTGGYTDVELKGEELHCIIEAKRGWNLPTERQLSLYAERLEPKLRHTGLVVLAECRPEYATRHLPVSVGATRLFYRSWSQLHQLSLQRSGSARHAERILLRELSTYLGGLITMQNHRSNLAYVVSISTGMASPQIAWIDLIERKRRYFHPFGGNGWPTEPPNYLAFRYRGKLQSIHHVESYEVLDNLSLKIPELSSVDWSKKKTHLLYRLGPGIRPQHEVRTGSIYPSGRVWAMIDTLLTCKSVSEARDLTKKRLGQSS